MNDLKALYRHRWLFLLFVFAMFGFISCNTNSPDYTRRSTGNSNSTDTLTYPFKAQYSSDLSMPANHEYAQRVLTVWKMYENKQFDSMRPYYADTVTYDDANGNHFQGPAAGLLEIAKKEMENLDSLRFDISMWETVHSNDSDEDWINIWSKERVYPKNGRPDTSLMTETWKIKDGRIYYFNQYTAKLPKK
jgi:hypothetical protein